MQKGRLWNINWTTRPLPSTARLWKLGGGKVQHQRSWRQGRFQPQSVKSTVQSLRNTTIPAAYNAAAVTNAAASMKVPASSSQQLQYQKYQQQQRHRYQTQQHQRFVRPGTSASMQSYGSSKWPWGNGMATDSVKSTHLNPTSFPMPPTKVRAVLVNNMLKCSTLI